jgi:hypothetical protein
MSDFKFAREVEIVKNVDLLKHWCQMNGYIFKTVILFFLFKYFADICKKNRGINTKIPSDCNPNKTQPENHQNLDKTNLRHEIIYTVIMTCFSDSFEEYGTFTA